MLKKTMIAVLFTGTLVVAISGVSEAAARDASQKSTDTSPRLSGDKPWCETPDSKQPGKAANASCRWDTYEACMRGKSTNAFCYPQSEINK